MGPRLCLFSALASHRPATKIELPLTLVTLSVRHVGHQFALSQASRTPFMRLNILAISPELHRSGTNQLLDAGLLRRLMFFFSQRSGSSVMRHQTASSITKLAMSACCKLAVMPQFPRPHPSAG
eukprot:Blabericola_migrator_1__7488@NODE_3822_length_1486_cov_150_965469_g2371_i0_p1_GENE_NODE_3822_length_1486_cov_150_965469_g2371_i0NODE_3822_length_1486_cov_150_965469_g2371_i0_p1_ORF_typecomplete_len124_score1_45CLN6/PF15156_6/0_2_NODE_3822_length_1486_cov_150_965469_g2371_i08371208